MNIQKWVLICIFKISVYIYICMQTYIHMHIHNIYPHTYTLYAYKNICMFNMYIKIYACSTCIISMHISTYIYSHICLFTYASSETWIFTYSSSYAYKCKKNAYSVIYMHTYVIIYQYLNMHIVTFEYA